MITVTDLGKHFGARTLFEGVNLELNAGHRYGLIGANGSGKTTFLKILIGDEPSSDGAVSLKRRARLGVLRQDRFMDDEERILDVAMRGDEEVFLALKAQTATDDAAVLAHNEDVIAAGDGYTLEARAGAVLEGLGIPAASHPLPLRTLSGGFKLRVLLAQVLLSRPDALLLDEPTNHLDILSIRWLEKFLANYNGCAVVISHDRRFIENVTTDILDVDYGTITPYALPYRLFVGEKELRREQKETELSRKQAEIDRKRAFVDRFGAKNTKAAQAQSRLKQIEKIEATMEDLATSSRRAPRFAFPIARESGKDVLTIEGLHRSFGEKTVLRGVDLLVKRGEKVAIIGGNGIGKSTLLKIITGGLPPDRGRVVVGHEVRLGYFAQDHKDVLEDINLTPYTFLQNVGPALTVTEVRSRLGAVLFSGDDVKKSVGALSGGEAARLVLCALAVQQPNVLLLDEPTNHLDTEAIDALVEALQAYAGTLVFVSHDRWFVERLANRIVELKPDGVHDFKGSWAEYLEKSGDDHLDADAVRLKQKALLTPDDGEAGGSWQDQKKRRNQRMAQEKRRDQVLASLEKKEARRSAIAALWAKEGFYTSTPADEVRSLQEEDEALEEAVAALVAEWEQLEAALAEP